MTFGADPPSGSTMRLLCLWLAGCAFGASPIVGYSQTGLVLGGEVSAGVPFANVTGGYEPGHGVLRVDVVDDPLVNCTPSSGLGGRVGIGFDLDRLGEPHGPSSGGIAAAVSGGGASVRDPDRSSAWLVGLELGVRYVGRWEIVLLPRAEVRLIPAGAGVCERT